MAEFVEHYLSDERLQIAYLGQGVIGTNASPFDPGTASIRFHHASGRLGGMPGMWGYVSGGMGMVSFYFCDAAREAGATVVSGVPVARILPGEGVELEGGERICSAHRHFECRSAPDTAPARRRGRRRLAGAGRARSDRRLHREAQRAPARAAQFHRAPRRDEPHHYGQINAPLTKDEWKAGFAAARRGELPEHLWCELYFQSVHDPSVVPAGQHTMSVFAQYVPYKFAQGTWDDRRDEVRSWPSIRWRASAPTSTRCRDRCAGAGAAGHRTESRPHRRPHLSGRMPAAYMWANRLSARTPMHGVYLCGACTHPGGSVIGINGRNAAMAVLKDLKNLALLPLAGSAMLRRTWPITPALKRGIRFRDLALFYVVVRAQRALDGDRRHRRSQHSHCLDRRAHLLLHSARRQRHGALVAPSGRRRHLRLDARGLRRLLRLHLRVDLLDEQPALLRGVLYFGAASALFAFGPRAQALNGNPLYYIAFAVFWLAVITLLNIRGVDAGKWLNNIGALGSLLPLSVLILLAAVSYWRFGPATHITAASLVPHWSLDNAVFWSSVFFAFSAIEAASAMGDEIQNPRRAIPWRFLSAAAFLTIGYIGGTAALLVALPSDAVGGPDGFVNGIHALAGRLGLGWLLAPIALLVALNAVGGAAANLSSTARLPFVAGVDRYLPPAFGWIHPRYRTPWVAIAVYGAAGIVVALLGQAGTTVRGAYNVLVSMSVISLFLPYLFLFSAMIRHAEPSRARSPPRSRRQASSDRAGLGRPGQHRRHHRSFGHSRRRRNQQASCRRQSVGGTCAGRRGVAVFLFSRFKARGGRVSVRTNNPH